MTFRTMAKSSEKQAGFTLVEIIISLAVLSIFFGTVAPLLLKFNEAMEKKFTLAEMKEIEKALFNFYRDTGQLPTDTPGEGLELLTADTSMIAGFNGPYLTISADKAEIKDAWGREYQLNYTPPAVSDIRTTQTFILTSTGPDFELSTTNDNLILTISTREVTNEIMIDTLERLRVVMAVVAEFQLDLAHSNILTELATSATGYSVSQDSGCDPPSDGAIDHGALVEQLSCFYRRDQWGDPLLWHDETNQFYSVGPNRTDNTGIATTIQPGDIGGNF